MPKTIDMPGLIDKKALLEILCFGCTKDRNGICCNEHGRCAEYTIIKLMPTIEAEPVRHGRWIAVSCYEACGGDEEAWMAHGNPTAYHYCSECRDEAYLNEEGKEILSDYCPFCGADMRDGGADNV